MPICTVIEQGGRFAIVTTARGEILQKIKILPPEVAPAMMKAIADQSQDVLYKKGVAAKTNSGMYPKSIW